MYNTHSHHTFGLHRSIPSHSNCPSQDRLRSHNTSLFRGCSSSSKQDSMIPLYYRPRNRRRLCSRSRITGRSIYLLHKTVCSRDNNLRPYGMCSTWGSFLRRRSRLPSLGHSSACGRRESLRKGSSPMAQRSRIPYHSSFRETHSTSQSTGHSNPWLRNLCLACCSSR